MAWRHYSLFPSMVSVDLRYSVVVHSRSGRFQLNWRILLTLYVWHHIARRGHFVDTSASTWSLEPGLDLNFECSTLKPDPEFSRVGSSGSASSGWV